MDAALLLLLPPAQPSRRMNRGSLEAVNSLRYVDSRRRNAATENGQNCFWLTSRLTSTRPDHRCHRQTGTLDAGGRPGGQGPHSGTRHPEASVESGLATLAS